MHIKQANNLLIHIRMLDVRGIFSQTARKHDLYANRHTLNGMKVYGGSCMRVGCVFLGFVLHW